MTGSSVGVYGSPRWALVAKRNKFDLSKYMLVVLRDAPSELKLASLEFKVLPPEFKVPPPQFLRFLPPKFKVPPSGV